MSFIRYSRLIPFTAYATCILVVFIHCVISEDLPAAVTEEIVGYVSSVVHLPCDHHVPAVQLKKLQWMMVGEKRDMPVALYRQWDNGTQYFNSLAGGRAYLNVKTGVLVLNNASLSDAGNYNCLAYQGGVLPTPLPKRLVIHAMPTDISVQTPGVQHSVPDKCQDVKLDSRAPHVYPVVCSVRSLPACQLSWKAIDQLAVNVSHSQTCHTDLDGLESCQLTAVINVPQLSDSAPLTCLVTFNDGRREKQTTELCVTIVPRGGRGVWVVLLAVTLVILCLVAVLVAVFIIRRRQQQQQQESKDTDSATPKQSATANDTDEERVRLNEGEAAAED